jgi:trans-2,3-dihydro-3-hydroxyanthranilate isomerase
MSRLPFYIVDVFAEKKYAGNQLGVFPNAGGLSGDQMQKLAKEMNYSETTFILSPAPVNGGYNVRIFTPDKEIPFAGHPTLGTAYIIQQEIIGQLVDTVILNLKVGQIPVIFNYGENGPDTLWMHQKEPTFGAQIDAGTISDVLNLQETHLDDRYPIEEVSTGLPFIVVPLKTLDSLKQIRPEVDKCLKLLENLSAKAILAFCPETYLEQHDLCVRVFAHYYGVPEDPATGSANGCLAGYLAKHRYFGESSIDIRVEQGYEIGRPSLLFLKAEKNADKIDVLVGGKVIETAKGEFV